MILLLFYIAGSSLGFLRSHPVFSQMRQIVQSNPGALAPMLQQLGQNNPQLLEVYIDTPIFL